MSGIDLFEAIYTARAMRRLKPDPVPEALLTQVLNAAIRAGSAGNAQNWHFIVVRDPDLRRELGAINVGGPGEIVADGKTFSLDKLDCAYLPKGTQSVSFECADAQNPAKFYFLSCPAHAAHPVAMMKSAEATPVNLGAQETSNKRTIYKFIHQGGIQSCQLVMGLTVLEPGNVWNSFPPHTHWRRTEIYFYFDLGDKVLSHFFGEPQETRHLFMHNDEVALSPNWSMHFGCGTGNYKFIWGMAGENQVFDDMDAVQPLDLR